MTKLGIDQRKLSIPFTRFTVFRLYGEEEIHHKLTRFVHPFFYLNWPKIDRCHSKFWFSSS